MKERYSRAGGLGAVLWPCFPGLLGEKPRMRRGGLAQDSAFSTRCEPTLRAQGQTRAGDGGLCRGDPGRPLWPARDPEGHGVTGLFLSPLSRFYRQLLGWDINYPGEFIDNFDVTEHRRNYPHVQNVKFEKNQVQRHCGGSRAASPTMRVYRVCFPEQRGREQKEGDQRETRAFKDVSLPLRIQGETFREWKRVYHLTLPPTPFFFFVVCTNFTRVLTWEKQVQGGPHTRKHYKKTLENSLIIYNRWNIGTVKSATQSKTLTGLRVGKKVEI